MSRYSLIIVFMLGIGRLAAQQPPMWSNQGAQVSVRSGALLSIHGNALNGSGGIHYNTDTVALFNDWTNVGGNTGFLPVASGIVRMMGDSQRVSGTDVTRFWDLRLEETGKKYADIDVEVGGFLRLNDREFVLDVHTVRVLSPALASVSTGLAGTFGFVSSLADGGLQRATDQAVPYFYPVGSSTGPLRYRPVELTPAAASPNAYKVRMAHVDASTENFDRNVRQNTICEVNPNFYHRIRRMAGSDGFRLRTYYDPTIDGGDWDGTAHWQNQPQWEKVEPNTAGIDATLGLSYLETVPFVNNLNFPAFALANISDSIALTASANPACPGDTVTYTAQGGFVQYQFFVNGILVQNSPDSTYTAVFNQSDVVEVTAFNLDCVAFGFPDTMVLYQNSIALTANPNPACFYDFITFTATPGFLNYQFFVNGQAIQNGPGNTYITDTLSTGDQVQVVGTDSVCDWTSAPVLVIIFNKFISLNVNRDSVCTDSAAIFTATPGFFNYEFLVNGVSVQNGLSNTLTWAPFQDGDSVVVVGYDSTCFYPSNAVIMSLYTNSIGLQGLPDTICAGGDVSFTATPGFVNYDFFLNGNLIYNGPDSIFTDNIFAEGDQIYVVGTDAHCPYNSNLDTVHVYQNSIALSANALTVCTGDTVNFTATPGFVDYVFFVNGNIVQTGPDNTLQYAGFDGNDTVQVEGLDANCPYGSDIVVINLYQNSIALSATDTVLCAADTVGFTATPGFLQYDFYVNGLLAQSGPSAFFTLDTVANGDSVSVVGTDAFCSYGAAAIVLGLYSNAVTLDAPLQSICPGETVTLQATPGFVSYVFSQNGQIVHTDSLPDWETGALADGDLFSVTAFDGFCFYESDTLSVTVFDTVWVNAVGDTTLYQGQSQPLGTLVSLGVISYSWSPGTWLSCVSCPDPVATPLESTVYTVTVESADGCVASDTVTIIVLPAEEIEFLIPNCITPNGDGANDTWIIGNLSLFDNHEIIILNRWGSEVFRSTDYQNDFDGTWNGGKLPAGTYYYLIRLNTAQIYKGPFIIIRE